MALLKHALLARDLKTDRDGKLTSIVGIVDTCGGFVASGGEQLTLLFWCTGAPAETIDFHVEIASPTSVVRTDAFALTIDGKFPEEVAALPVAIDGHDKGRHMISLWFGDERVWERPFTVGVLAAAPARVQ